MSNSHTSARPEVRGTADVGWQSLFLLPLNLPRTHSRLYHHNYVSTDRRVVTEMNGWYRREPWLRTIFGRLRRRECCMLGAPSSQPTVPLKAARLVIHRQTSVHERRKWTRSFQSRSGILAYLCTRQHWLWITVELHVSGARNEEAVAREGGRYAPVRGVLGSEPLSLRTHRHRGRSRPLRSAVVEYQAPSVAV